MKQILQSFKTGNTELADIPAPQVKKGHVLIKTKRSLVSLGTERMLVEFGKANLVAKARQQPEKVKMVLNKIKSEGLMPTLETVFNRLEQPLPLGYCNVGVVVEVGEGVNNFKIGDRVASNGSHAEYVCIPKNLVARIPENVSDEEAAFTVVGSIGLQGIRLVEPTIGETIVVVGLGLIGLLSAQLLKASGCNVIGYDLDNNKVEIARQRGILAFNPSKGTDTVKYVLDNTSGIGADAVIITASAKTNDIISQAAKMSRKKGRIVLVGVIGLNISRADFYEKELSFQVSCSYGPGRYDEEYEQRGNDYPLPYVRWTENRNFSTILNSIASGGIDVKSLISEIVPISEFDKVYGAISSSNSIASIFKYSEESDATTTVKIAKDFSKGTKNQIAIIGAGNFAKMSMLPALKGTGAEIKYIVSAKGVNGTALAKKHNIKNSTTNYDTVLNDEEVGFIIISTRHNLHADMVIKGLEANKHVFVEKPLAINEKELRQIEKAYEVSKGSLMVGFNRRFSPHIVKMKSLVGDANMNIVATMNAGAIPKDVWVHDMKVGGGRIVGEACHYLDLIVFLAGSKIKAICLNAMGANPSENTDNVSILCQLENGSNACLNYFANGSKAYSKERIELFSQERTLIMDNFIYTRGYGFKNFKKLKTKLNKGHKAQFAEIVKRAQNGNEIGLIPFDELLNVSKASFGALKSLKEGKWIVVD